MLFSMFYLLKIFAAGISSYLKSIVGVVEITIYYPFISKL